LGIQSTLHAGAVRNDNKIMNVLSLTADTTLTQANSGSIINNQADGNAINLTLPAQAKGLNFIFSCVEDQSMTVTADTADTMVVFNDVAADALALSTSSEKAGGAFFVYSDGTNWIAHEMVSEGQTSVTTT